MTKTAIRNLHSDKPIPPRFCDVVIEDGKPELSTKPFMGKVGNSGFLFCKTISTSHQLL